MAESDTSGSEARRPDAAHPDAPRPDAAHPDAARPDAARPDAPRPDAPRPDAPKGRQDTDKDAGRPGDKGGKEQGRPDDKGQGEKPQPRPARWPWFVGGLVLVGFVAAVLFEVFVPHPDVWTDDAYVMVHYATVAPRVSGQVATVQVDDNQLVRAGQVLVTLDPRDYQASVAMAEAAVARDTAQVGNAGASITRQPSVVAQEQATVASAQARLGFSQSDARRYTNLAATGAGTQQQHQQADTQNRQDQASLAGAQAGLEAARRQMDVLHAQQTAAQGTVASDRAQLDQARLNLSYATITAPVDGMVGERTVEPGNYVAPGATLMTVVPLDQVYILANYREVALRHVRPGQRVTIHVDAYGIDLAGVVDSVPPASGATFAAIPPNNATGNFTKIVQRLPVKVVLAPGQPAARLLRVGFSVETTIHTGLEDVAGEQARSSGPLTAR